MKLYCFILLSFIGILSCTKDKNEIKNKSEESHISNPDLNSSLKKTDKTKNHKTDDSLIQIKNPHKLDKSTKNNKDSLKLKTHKGLAKDSSNKYYVYLSLDDGPQLPGTNNCRNILEKYNIRATFFMIGQHNSGIVQEKLVDSINHNPLFIVCNHSNSHANNKYSLFYKNSKTAFQDFITAENKLKLKHKIARLPGRNTWAVNHEIKGESSAFNVAKKLDSIGYSVYGWDLEWRFVHTNIPVESATEMIKKVKNTLKYGKTHSPNSIVILVHDRMFNKPQYADSLQKFISVLKEDKHYIFETLDNYPSLSSAEKNK